MEINTVIMPKELTAENGAKALLLGEFAEHQKITCHECYCLECNPGDPDNDCELCGGSGELGLDVPVSWTTIKAIYAMAVEHLGMPVETVKP